MVIKKIPIIPQYEVERIRKIHHEGKAKEDFHNLFAGEYIGDIVYGANDGIITTFAVVAGVAGAALSPTIVLILGVANLFADGFSMAAGNYLARKSEKEYKKRLADAMRELTSIQKAAKFLISTFS